MTPEQVAQYQARISSIAVKAIELESPADGRSAHLRVQGRQCPLEHDEQVAVIQWCDLNPPANLIFSIDNGAFKKKAAAGKAKARGVRPGVPDLCLPIARKEFHSLYIEMKRRVGGSLSSAQSDWLILLAKHGNKCVVAYGADEAVRAIKEYLA